MTTRSPLVRSLGALVAGSVSLVGCQLPPAPPAPPAPPPKYYGVGVALEGGAAAESHTDGVKVLEENAAALLKPGTTIAFFPPDQCRTTDAAPSGAVEQERYLQMDCGVLLSSLEASAADEYKVVSWQVLKGADPLARAAERKVQVVFEVDQLSVNDRAAGKARYTGLNFFEQTNPGDRAPLVVDRTVADRCKVGVDQAMGGLGTAAEWSATLAAKAVDVQSGLALWYYKRTISETSAGKEQLGLDFYFDAPGQQDYVPPEREFNALQKAGGALLISSIIAAPGIGLRVIGAVNNDQQPISAIGGSFILIGGIALVAGAVLLGIGNAQAKKAGAPADTRALPPPRYPSAQETLCTKPPVTPPWLQVAAPAPTMESGSSSYQFNEQTAGASDPERERRERLVGSAAQDFVGELNKLTGAAGGG